MNNTLRTLSISFDLPITAQELPVWQQTFEQWAGWESSDSSKYPLIQYQIWKQHATIYALNAGVDKLQDLLAQKDWVIEWEGRERTLLIEDLFMREHTFQILPEPKTYQVFQWVAFGPEELKDWQSCRNLTQRASFLEKKLLLAVSNFLHAIDYQPEVKLEVYLQELRDVQVFRWNDHLETSFRVVYDTNIDLPTAMALGQRQYIEQGFGMQRPYRPDRRARMQQLAQKMATPNPTQS